MVDNRNYPRDFNLFVASGTLDYGLRDVAGSVAVAGNVTIRSFQLNHRRLESVALVGQRTVNIAYGTVFGRLIYGEELLDYDVTYADPDFSRPTSPNNQAINFPEASSRLLTMSARLDAYDANGSIEKQWNLRFTGTDPELNVFSVSPEQLMSTYSYDFSGVPTSSTVIVNVHGASPVIENAGFVPARGANKILWNFPDATTLTIRSVGLVGSILAPRADANFTNGSITGTVVVGSGLVNVELYSVPFQMPGCGGCLSLDSVSSCLDTTWSCSNDTLVDDDGMAGAVAPEAGFLEIAGTPYIFGHAPYVSPTHRIWYSFHPAKIAPKSKPIAVFFNGGPGSATSAFLFSFNTAPMTLDPDVTGSAKIVANPNTWTDFANLLYIDAPATGFSYPVADANGQPSIVTNLDNDAAIFLRVIVAFLRRHPTLQRSRIMLVGESYGGVRAELMLKYLFARSTLLDPTFPYQDSQLASKLADHFWAVFGTSDPGAGQIATQFGHQVLIEPSLVGWYQTDYANNNHAPVDGCRSPGPQRVKCWEFDPHDQFACDVYNCDKPPGWGEGQGKTAAGRLMDVATLTQALGVDPRTIEWMHARARTTAYGRSVDKFPMGATPDMDNTFGSPLNSDDRYFVIQNMDAYTDLWDTPTAGAWVGTAFEVNVLNGVATFITASMFDYAIWFESIPYALKTWSAIDPAFVKNIGYDAPGGEPGWMSLIYTSFAPKTVPISRVYYAGHTVTMRAASAGQLKSDVSTWHRSH